MVDYNELYEILRKEKYSESLQLLPTSFLREVGSFFKEQKTVNAENQGDFMENLRTKKKFENSMSLFKELMLRRKKKLLNLVFVAAETGIMKRDYENMFSFEKSMFDSLIQGFETGDKALNDLLYNDEGEKSDGNKLVLFLANMEEFVSMSGEVVGPFNSGDLANLDVSVGSLLVSNGKARYIDE